VQLHSGRKALLLEGKGRLVKLPWEFVCFNNHRSGFLLLERRGGGANWGHVLGTGEGRVSEKKGKI